MKKIAFGFLIMLFNINIVNASPSAFFSYFKVVNGYMTSNYSKFNNMYTVYVDEDVHSMVFEYELEDYEASIIIKGNEFFEYDDNEVVVTVISSDDKIVQDYYFYIYKNKDDTSLFSDDIVSKLEITKKSNIHIESVIAILSFLLILFIYFILFLT